MPIDTSQATKVILTDTFTQFKDKVNILVDLMNNLPATLQAPLTRLGGTIDGLTATIPLSGTDDGDLFIINAGGLGIGDFLDTSEPTSLTDAIHVRRTSGYANVVIESLGGDGEGVLVLSSAAVGIGTSNPQANLEIYSTTTDIPASLRLTGYHPTDGGNFASLQFKGVSSGATGDYSGEIRLNAIRASDKDSAHLDFQLPNSYGVQRSIMYIDGQEGRVGIGTIAPGYQLHVSGVIATGTYGTATTGEGFRVSSTDIYGQTSAVDKVRIGVNSDSYFNGGNFGIGTTGPTNILQVHSGAHGQSVFRHTSGWGGVTIAAAGDGAPSLTFGSDFDTTFSEEYRITMHTDHSLRFAYGGTPDAEATNVAMKLDAAGLTTLASLRVDGALHDGTNVGSAGQFLSSTVSGVDWITLSASVSSLTDTVGTLTKWTSADVISDSIITESGAGKIGISELTPDQLLHIKGGNAQLVIEEDADEFVRIGVGETESTAILGWDDATDMQFGVYNSTTHAVITPRMTIDAAGNTGIGTTAPGALLYLKKAVLPQIVLETGTDQDSAIIFTERGGPNYNGMSIFYKGNPTEGQGGGQIYIGKQTGSSSGASLVINRNGQIGMGITYPVRDVDIVGTNSQANLRIQSDAPMLEFKETGDLITDPNHWRIAMDGNALVIDQAASGAVGDGSTYSALGGHKRYFSISPTGNTCLNTGQGQGARPSKLTVNGAIAIAANSSAQAGADELGDTDGAGTYGVIWVNSASKPFAGSAYGRQFDVNNALFYTDNRGYESGPLDELPGYLSDPYWFYNPASGGNYLNVRYHREKNFCEIKGIPLVNGDEQVMAHNFSEAGETSAGGSLGTPKLITVSLICLKIPSNAGSPTNEPPANHQTTAQEYGWLYNDEVQIPSGGIASDQPVVTSWANSTYFGLQQGSTVQTNIGMLQKSPYTPGGWFYIGGGSTSSTLHWRFTVRAWK